MGTPCSTCWRTHRKIETFVLVQVRAFDVCAALGPSKLPQHTTLERQLRSDMSAQRRHTLKASQC